MFLPRVLLSMIQPSPVLYVFYYEYSSNILQTLAEYARNNILLDFLNIVLFLIQEIRFFRT